MSSQQWLNREDSVEHEPRLARLDWLVSKTPSAKYWVFPGARISKYLFEETRYCFVYGQFLATIVLGLAYIEHTLAAMFYASGRNDLERADISTLLREATSYGWINQTELQKLEHARHSRNSVTHFRKPLDSDTVEYRAVIQNQPPYGIIEEDARYVMEAVLQLLDKNAV